MSEEKKGTLENTQEVVGKNDSVIETVASDFFDLKNQFENQKDSLSKNGAITMAERFLAFSDALFQINYGKSEENEYIDYIYNPHFPPCSYPANFFFLDTAETQTENEVVDPKIMEVELKAVAFAPDDNPVCFLNASGRGLAYVKEKHKKPMEEMALKMNFTSEQMEKIKKYILFGPEMNIFSLKMFSDEVVKNLPENHPAWKKENKAKMDSLAMYIDQLPQSPPDNTWVQCMDADDNKAFWNFDQTLLQSWYRKNGLPCPAILSAFATKCKVVMPTQEKVRIWDEKKQKWVVPWTEDDPRMLADMEIIENFIQKEGLAKVYRVSQVRTAFNDQILDENGQEFGKGTSAYKAAMYFSKVTGRPYITIPAKAKTAGDSDSDSLMAEALNCGFVLVDSKTNPGKRTAYYMVGKAKAGHNGPKVLFEALKGSLKWLGINL